YNPSAKPRRLGRPRKHHQNLDSPSDSSSRNLNHALVSKFRFDNQPIEGPGSRGGKIERAIPRGKITMLKKKQSTLPFAAATSPLKAEPKRATRTRTPSKKADGSLDAPQQEKKKEPKKTVKREPKKDTKKKATKAASPKKRTKQEDQATKKLKTSKIVSTSRTTVLNTSHKISRQLPGPIVGLFYDLYDDNVLGATQNAKASSEKIAFGFPVLKNPYASDILFILEFLNKFLEIVKFPNISPQEVEQGLSLPSVEAVLSEKYVPKPAKPVEDYDVNYISPQMKSLFLRLMGMVLNRKREVTSHSSAILELKPLVINLGLPSEWRENTIKPDEFEDEPPGSPVDPNHPDIIVTRVYKSGYSQPTYNPFVLAEFEQFGLQALEPKDRLILLRVLVQWSLSSCEALKSLIFKNSQNTDIPGDKETFYASRAILKGFKNAMDTKIEAEAKFNKREDDVKFIDPTSDPLEHCFRIRIHEQLAGDVGFHIGRFYLCRMADKTNGGLASVKKMTSTWAGSGNSGELPSNFKLFVQDVHGMLESSLAYDGVDHTSSGEEIPNPRNLPDASQFWYEIASDVEELSDFVNFLSKRMGYTGTQEDDIVPMTSLIYRPMFNLFNYLSGLLPLLIRQEKVSQIIENKDEPRTSRQKGGINYNDKVASQHGYFEDGDEEGNAEEEEYEEYEEGLDAQSEDDDYME
ncbi:uncharacterized protein CANTADRAFT_42172, partial [Suhomyces tanzawaensis NRRL Y-17324]